ncbi:hypothetical protein HYPSUDRAFT_176107 [Hypholoma sublateritium FD-334 SS-4]|uniref:Uncharacterized protein n=1 Tax=Hypholoma sublateritium (strain FD-334 SS-4) TaxID=945553 RepID=A0A0D2QCE1_HYPSF|nr:hypothetical protein HYPSUDRAFT_176107 [Hypholoma sublateritium FD-334 SS-4]
MAPTIPSSLSPQICILASSDLTELLEKAALPTLPHILQSFSPLPQVTTRTTTLVSTPHTSFHLRFSDLIEVEEACREDEEQRAIRTIDWMTARIGKRCAKWVQDVELSGDKETLRTPWWDELRRCSEGDFVPSRTESWNHPVAVILAVSTLAPNPLAAITALHARSLQFPTWVDTNFLRYTLIIHPHNSPLSDEEATALFNAVKKQFGLHSYLLPLKLPKTPPPPIPVPALLPRLPSPPTSDAPSQPNPSSPTSHNGFTNATIINTLRMEDPDIQQTARFTREFLVMSLIPWMEKCVVEWNENFSSTRRLPSRLFSSTRRLFGSQSSSPAPPSSTASSAAASRSSISSINGSLTVPSQQRRLAEFSTILGDYKLAITVWEALRKESKGGSDVLPLLLAPGPTVPLHAQTALSSIYQNMADLPPHAQLRALSHAVRWECGIASQDFLSNMLEGERWLVWAASNSEEAPSALLLAQAALLSVKKRAWRRAALWYVLAANRLEKCGIKPLTMYFLRKAQDIYQIKPPKELSPSFWDSEGKSPNVSEGLEEILSGIEHPLGRLLYTTGDLAGAVKLFLKLLRGSSAFSNAGLPMLGDGSLKVPGNDKVYLDDFKVAYNYWKSTDPEYASSADLRIPITLCVTKQSKLRFPGDTSNGDTDIWASRQDAWTTFSKGQGSKATIAPSGKVSTDELFWMDLAMLNPLDAEINLTNVTLVITATDPSTSALPDDFVEVETIKEITLGPKASISVPIALKSKRPVNLSVTHAKYDFLGQLPILESLASRGRRLHDTALQRQQPTYAPDVLMQVKVVPSDHKLDVRSVDGAGPLVLLQGQNKSTTLWLTNSGTYPINEVWMVSGADDEIWMGSEEIFDKSTTVTEIIQSSNSLKPADPHRISLGAPDESRVLQPGEHVELPFIIHAETAGGHELCLLFIFREDDSHPFHSTKLALSYEVAALFDLSISAEPSQAPDRAYVLDIDITNTSPTASIDITQVTTVSPQWSCHSLTKVSGTLGSLQSSRILLGASPWLEGTGCAETSSYVAKKLDGVLKGAEVDSAAPPTIDIHCDHISESSSKRSIKSEPAATFIHSGRRKHVSRDLTQVHSYISTTSHPSIFPLYNPAALDIVVFWEIPSQRISGHLNVYGITLGAGHAALEDILEDADNAKTKRSMYAETRRENREILDAIRGSDWNTEMNPITVSLKDLGAKVHDFDSGPCRVPVEFQLRNHSLQLPAKYTLKLNGSKSTDSTDLAHLPPPYLGRLTFRGTISPSELVNVQPHLWITRPGSYSLSGWSLETEISIPSRNGDSNGRIKRYLQEPSTEDIISVLVCNTQRSSDK